MLTPLRLRRLLELHSLGNLGSYHRAIKTVECRGAEVFRRGPDAPLRLQSRRVIQVVRACGRARRRIADAALGHGAGARHQLSTTLRPADRLKQGYAHLADAQTAEGRAAARWSRGSLTRLPSAMLPIPTGDQMVREQAYSAAMGDAVEEVSRRPRRRDALRREPDEPASVAPLHEGRHAGARDRARSSRRSKA